MVTYKNDINLMDEISNYKIVVIGTNVYCTLSQGIQRDVALNYPYTRKLNLTLKYGDVSRLGDILTCKEEGEITFILAFIYKGYAYRASKTEDTLEYDKLVMALKKINTLYKGETIAMPLLGCSRFDGNGDKYRVKEILAATLTDVNAIVYDYEQKSRDEKQKEIRKKELALKKISHKLYYEAVRKRKEEAEKRFLKNNFARY